MVIVILILIIVILTLKELMKLIIAKVFRQ